MSFLSFIVFNGEKYLAKNFCAMVSHLLSELGGSESSLALALSPQEEREKSYLDVLGRHPIELKWVTYLHEVG